MKTDKLDINNLFKIIIVNGSIIFLLFKFTNSLEKIYNTKYKLNKDFKVKKIKDIKITPDIINYNNPLCFKNIEEYKQLISIFNKRLKENISKENLTLFYNNLHNLEITLFCNEEKNNFKQTLGIYDNFNFHIQIKNNENKIVLFHELLHMSSSSLINKYSCLSGFHQMDYKTNLNIGFGLNEGYTELLTERLFPDYNNNNIDAYIFEKLISSLIEDIVGIKNMENFYFKANLYNLILELSKYNSFENIMTFISLLDGLNKYFYLDKYNLLEIVKIKKSIIFIIKFINNCYIEKYKNDSKKIKYKIFDFYNKLSNLDIKFNIKNHLYKLDFSPYFNLDYIIENNNKLY